MKMVPGLGGGTTAFAGSGLGAQCLPQPSSFKFKVALAEAGPCCQTVPVAEAGPCCQTVPVDAVLLQFQGSGIVCCCRSSQSRTAHSGPLSQLSDIQIGGLRGGQARRFRVKGHRSGAARQSSSAEEGGGRAGGGRAGRRESRRTWSKTEGGGARRKRRRRG